MKQKLQQILDHYGPEAQFEQFRCEVAELGLALSRLAIHNQKINIDQVAEEIADVMNMADQFCMTHRLTDRITVGRMEKIERQLGRMQNENYRPKNL